VSPLSAETLPLNTARAYAVSGMPSSMTWLATVIRIAIGPVLIGTLALLFHSPRASTDLAAALGLVLLAAIHSAYWWDPWRRKQRHAVAALGAMVVINFVLLNLLGLAQPLLWLYPALVAGAGLRAPAALAGIALTAFAAAAPLALEGGIVHPIGPMDPADALGPSHSVLLSIILAGLGMSAVRQLMAVNADLHETRAELADLAVAADRERLARELHDLLARTLSLIAVKAELASRLSARGDAAAEELSDVQRLARQAVRDVRQAVTGSFAPSFRAELTAAEAALYAAGIEVKLDVDPAQVDAAHETTIAWALREAITNVVKHSGARTCRIALRGVAGATSLDVEDDGRGPGEAIFGTGLKGLADRVQALGGTLRVESREQQGFKLRVQLGSLAPTSPNEVHAG
jgi:two-component system, NarL family, sensor histidine kinase DesK